MCCRSGTLVGVVPVSGSLRWAVDGKGRWVAEDDSSRSRLSRRRRANAPAGTKKRRDVWVTAEEEASLIARAARERVTVPNLMISAALSERSDSPTERRAIAAELMSLHNLLARSSNNINQLARQANATGEFPAEAREALKFIRSVAMRIDDAIDGLV
ncbi:MobC family plasmid mobilization relaxosome protein [Arthrobacter sp. CAU 1506]|nr:MobC family plasmid mobilization relaxosome protein [Arthrobacter sp. CAU 1506]